METTVKKNLVFENDLGDIRECLKECGGAVLSMGPIMLHFGVEELKELHDLVNAAVASYTKEVSIPAAKGKAN